MTDSYCDDCRWLFNDDTSDYRGNYAAKMILVPETGDRVNYTEYIKAKYFTNQTAQQNNDDIHWEIFQFIADVAMYHKEIDPPTGLAKAINSIKQTMVDTFVDEIGIRTALNTVESAIPTTLNTRELIKTAIETGLNTGLANANVAGRIDSLLTWLITDVNFKNFYKNNVVNKIVDKFKNINPAQKTDFTIIKDGTGVTDIINTFKTDAFTFVKTNYNTYQGLPKKTLADPKVLNIYKNTYGKWDKLTPYAKSLYQRFLGLLKLNSGSWEKASEVEYMTAVNNPTNFRLNLEKHDNIGSDDTAFSKALPLLTSFENRNLSIWKNQNENIALGATGTATNLLADLYNTIYNGKGGTTAILVGHVPSTKSGVKRFSIKGDHIIEQALLAISEMDIPDQILENVPPDNYNFTETYVRRGNKLFKVNKDNLGQPESPEPYDLSLPDVIKKISNDPNCYGTGVKTLNDKQKCDKFFFECLLNKNTADAQVALKELLESEKGFFKASVDEIKNFHPMLALQALKRFGFKLYDVFDATAGQQLSKVQSVNYWLTHNLRSKFNDEELRRLIRKDTSNILQYLELLSQYINANPAILNNSYTGPSNESVGELPELPAYAKSLKLNYERPISGKDNIKYDLYKFKGHMKLFNNRPFMFNNSTYSTPFGSYLFPQPVVQVGGNKCENVIRFLNNGGNLTSASYIHTFWQALQKNLANRNKSLDKKDKEIIEKKIRNQMALEKDILRTLCYIDSFNYIKDSLQDYKTSFNTVETITKFVNSYEAMTNKKSSIELSLFEILSKLQNAIDSTDESNNAKEISLKI